MLTSSPQQKSFGRQLSSEIPASVLLEQELNNLSKLIQNLWVVGWPNIGLVATRPAGPVPTALYMCQQTDTQMFKLFTLLWKKHCSCYTVPPVFSSSGHHSDGVVCVIPEVSESNPSCSRVTELQG